MQAMFYQASAFKGDISKWDVSSVTYMSCMFIDSASFSDDISKWDVSSVTYMSRMFFDTTSFNGVLDTIEKAYTIDATLYVTPTMNTNGHNDWQMTRPRQRCKCAETHGLFLQRYYMHAHTHKHMYTHDLSAGTQVFAGGETVCK